MNALNACYVGNKSVFQLDRRHKKARYYQHVFVAGWWWWWRRLERADTSLEGYPNVNKHSPS